MLATTDPTSSIYVWSLVLIVVAVAGFVLVSWVKKRVRRPDEPPSIGFSLADLRELLRKGQITPEEFERARGRLAAGMKRQEKPDKPA
jgi:uncharacterized membrane protein